MVSLLPGNGKFARDRYKTSKIMRPLPPEDIIGDNGIRFEPAPDLGDWVHSTSINEAAGLVNDHHAHLRVATRDVPNGRNGRRIIGQCETGLPPAGK